MAKAKRKIETGWIHPRKGGYSFAKSSSQTERFVRRQPPAGTAGVGKLEKTRAGSERERE